MTDFLSTINKAIFITKEGRSIPSSLWSAIAGIEEALPLDALAAFAAAGVDPKAVTVSDD